MKKSLFTSARDNFLAGLAVVLPAVVSVAVIVWLFGTVSRLTDILLFFLPRKLTHVSDGSGRILWYWSIVALLLAAFLVGVVGRLARNYIGLKMIQLVDMALLRIPLLNKLYGALKQVNEAFTSSSKSSFKQVVLVQFPHPGHYALGFITGADTPEMELKTHSKILSVFVPTTPNPTSGFLILAPESQLIKLEMSVADGVKYIISLGAVTPDHLRAASAGLTPRLPPAEGSQPGAEPDHG